MVEIAKRLATGANVYILSCSGGVEGGPADVFSKVAEKRNVSVFGFSKPAGVTFTLGGDIVPYDMKIIQYIAGRSSR